MKTLLLFPPQWMPISPHFALPTLLGQFADTEYEAEVMDLNVDFYNTILTSSYVQESLRRAKEMLPELKENIKKYYKAGKKFDDYNFDQQNELAKSIMIEMTLNEHKNSLAKTALIIDQSVKILKDEKYYYNPKLFCSAANTIK